MLIVVTLIDLTGYLGTALVLLSFLMSSMKSLRMVSIMGCISFIVYGILLDYAVPIIITNVSIIIINVFALLRNKE